MIGYYNGSTWVGRKGVRTGIYQFEPPILAATGLTTSRTYLQREAFQLQVQPTKFRVTIGNWNSLNNAFVSPSALNNVSMSIGRTVMSGSNPTSQLQSAGTMIPCASSAASGTWLTSDWIPASTFALTAGNWYSLDICWGVPDGKMAASTGTGAMTWELDDTSGTATTAIGTVNPSFGAAGYNSKLFRFIEYQVDDGGFAPSVFAIGNSAQWYMGGDTNNVWGTQHTWHQRWAQKNTGFTAGNLGFSAGLASNFTSGSSMHWSLYDNLIDIPLNPDMVVYLAVASSDLSNITTPTGTDITNIESSISTVAAVGKTKFPNAKHVWTDIPPRTEFTNSTADNARLTINSWMHTLPTGIDDCIYLDYAVTDSASPARYRTGLTTDGTHPNVAGNKYFGDMIPVRRR